MKRARGWAERLKPWEDLTPSDLDSIRQNGAPARRMAYNRFAEILNDHRDYYELVDAVVEVLLYCNRKSGDVYVDRWRVKKIEERDHAGLTHRNQPITFHPTSSTFGAFAGGRKYQCYAIRVVTDD